MENKAVEKIDFFDCLDLKHLSLEELNNMNDGELRPVFIVFDWLGDIHTATWKLYCYKSGKNFLFCGQESISNWSYGIYTDDNYEKSWVAYSEKPEIIPFVN